MLRGKVLMVTTSQTEEGGGHKIHLFMSEKTDIQERGKGPKEQRLTLRPLREQMLIRHERSTVVGRISALPMKS